MSAAQSIPAITNAIERERRVLTAWLDESYLGREDERFHTEIDIGYPGWDQVEDLIGHIFDNQLLQQLDETTLDSVLFFISRSEEGGRILAWLRNEAAHPFSNVGSLSYGDLLFLAETALTRADDYCDYQLVGSFRKCPSLDARAISIVRRFFDKQDEYTRRIALLTMQHLELPATVDCAIELWNDSRRGDPMDVEFARLTCLEVLRHFPSARPTFEDYLASYLATYDIDAADYRQAHLDRLTSGDVSPN